MLFIALNQPSTRDRDAALAVNPQPTEVDTVLGGGREIEIMHDAALAVYLVYSQAIGVDKFGRTRLRYGNNDEANNSRRALVSRRALDSGKAAGWPAVGQQHAFTGSHLRSFESRIVQASSTTLAPPVQ